MNSPSTQMKPDVTLSLTLSSPTNALKPEERGIKLIQLLLACANHASSGNLHRADACLQQISPLASISGDSMQRLASRFASALAIRLVKRWTGLYQSLNHLGEAKLDYDRALSIFTRVFPYLRFSYAIISRTLVQAMSQERAIHIIDLGSGDPKLWVPLLRTMSRFGQLAHGPPHLKITCVSSNKSVLEKLGQKLIQEAETLDMPFQFNPVNVKLSELNVDMLKIRSGESIAVTSVLNLHVLLAEDDRVEAQFSVNKDNIARNCKQMNEFLTMIRSISPKIVLLVEQESDHNLTRLVDRFVEGLHYYSAVFDSIDAMFGGGSTCEERVALEEMFGKEIDDIVACEGLERAERHERFAKWVVRFSGAGFRQVQLWYEMFEDAKRVIETYGSDGYMIVNQNGGLKICWHGRPLYSVSAWTCQN